MSVRKRDCVVGKFWLDLNDTIKKFLKSTTLESLVAQEKERIDIVEQLIDKASE